MCTVYKYDKLDELATKLHSEAWNLLREGKTLVKFEKVLRKFTYKFLEKWHEERYVMHSRQLDIVLTLTCQAQRIPAHTIL